MDQVILARTPRIVNKRPFFISLGATLAISLGIWAGKNTHEILHREEVRFRSIFVLVCPGESGIAFAIQENLLLTAAHVCEGHPTGAVIKNPSWEGEIVNRVWLSEVEDLAVWNTSPNVKLAALPLSDRETWPGEAVSYYVPIGDIGLAPAFGRVLKDGWIDGTVWPGASGGPIFNSSGEVAGVMSAIARCAVPAPEGSGYFAPRAAVHLITPRCPALMVPFKRHSF